VLFSTFSLSDTSHGANVKMTKIYFCVSTKIVISLSGSSHKQSIMLHPLDTFLSSA
jgi:hypothetical protein